MVTWPMRRTRAADSVQDELLTRAGAGDREALRRLLVPHEPALLRLCLSQTGNRADAEDAAQETLLQAIRALTKPGGFRGDAALKTWLIRIALHVCAAHSRRRRETVPWDDTADETRVAGPEEQVVNRAVLDAALQRLTPGQRAALTLQGVEGWSLREIAVSRGVSEKRVENDLYRARKALAAWEKERDGGK